MESAFDPVRLLKQLGALNEKAQLAFLLSCAERLTPNYSAFVRCHKWGDQAPLQRALDLSWNYLRGTRPTEREILACIRECEAVTPDTEDFDSLYVSSGLNAALCCTSALEFLLEASSQKVVDGASLARDTIDLYVQELHEMNPDAPDLEQQILLHPLMQRELAKQRSDLQYLSGVTLTPDVVRALELEWRAPGKSNIDIPTDKV